MRSPSPGVDDGATLTRAAGFSPVASTHGVRLAVHRLATADDPADQDQESDDTSLRPILLCHATGFHGMVWAPLARHLEGFVAFAPDLRGHGDSPAPADRDMDWNGFADDVLAVVDAMAASGIDVGHLVAAGHSKGGASLLLAKQRRPGTFGAIYCYEPVVMPPPLRTVMGADEGRANPLAEGALRRRATFASRDEAYANYASKLPLSALDPEALRAYVDHGFADQPDGTVTLKCRPEVESAVYRMGGLHDAFDHLGAVRCPVTIGVGEADEGGPAAFASMIVDALPQGRLAEYPDLGHFGPLEDPARIAASILDAVR
ncbi:MAG: alpha/beta fold hydrolase [Acidimicrobiales bacterium]